MKVWLRKGWVYWYASLQDSGGPVYRSRSRLDAIRMAMSGPEEKVDTSKWHEIDVPVAERVE